MTAPFLLPTEASRFPRLSPAQRILQAASDRAIMRAVVAEMNLKPGIGPVSNNDWHHDRQWAEQWR